MKKVYLAGQSNQHDPWRAGFKKLPGFDFYDPDIHSDQTSADTYFPQDLSGIAKSDFLVAYPSTKPSEGTWIEIGYFLALNTKRPGERCLKLIIIWPDARELKWALEFVKKAGMVVKTVEEAIAKLQEIAGKEL